MSWEDNVRKVDPYVPGEQPMFEKMIKLNTNECPYPPSPKVVEAVRDFDCNKLRLYPDPSSKRLTEAWAKRCGLAAEQVFAGVGSDDVLSVAFLTFFYGKKPILFPDITYSFYDVWTDVYRIPYEVRKLDENFRIVKEDYFTENGGIILANPNAPTGALESTEMIEEILQRNPDSVVIVDEAYIDFGGTSMTPLIEKYDNLLVVQTFSKSRALAGLRIGFAMGNRKLIQYMNDVKFSINSYTMNQPSLYIGTAAIEDEEYFKETVDKIVKTRERVKPQLKELGFNFADSKTNFIFAAHKSVSGQELFDACREQNIFIRHWNKPRIGEYLRISIGTDEEMDTLLTFLRGYLKNRS